MAKPLGNKAAPWASFLTELESQRKGWLAAFEEMERLGQQAIEATEPEEAKRLASALCDCEYRWTGDCHASAVLCRGLGFTEDDEI